MATYFESFALGSVTQLSDVEVFFYLHSKRTVANPGSSGAVYTFSKPAGSEFMIAIRSTDATWYNITDISSTSVTIDLRGIYGNASVVAYLFVTGSPPSSNGGFELYNERGVRVFNAYYPVARVLGVLTESGYTGESTANKVLAHVPMKEGIYRSYQQRVGIRGSCTVQYPQRRPGYQISERRVDSRTLVNSSTLSSENQATDTGYIPSRCSSSSYGGYHNVSDAREFKSLILNVTNI